MSKKRAGRNLPALTPYTLCSLDTALKFLLTQPYYLYSDKSSSPASGSVTPVLVGSVALVLLGPADPAAPSRDFLRRYNYSTVQNGNLHLSHVYG